MIPAIGTIGKIGEKAPVFSNLLTLRSSFGFVKSISLSDSVIVTAASSTTISVQTFSNNVLTKGNNYNIDGNSNTHHRYDLIKLTSTSFAVCYQNTSNVIRLGVGIVSGTTITFGTFVSVGNAQPSYGDPTITTTTGTNIFVIWNAVSGYGTRSTYTVSTSTLSFVDSTQYTTSYNIFNRLMTRSSTELVLTNYLYPGGPANLKGLAVSGNSITSYGNTTLETGTTHYGYNFVEIIDSTRVLFTYSSGGYVKLRIATFTNANTCTFGSEYDLGVLVNYNASIASYDTNRFILTYVSSGIVYYRIITVSGSTISAGTQVVVNSYGTLYSVITRMSANTYAIAFRNNPSTTGESLIVLTL